MEQIWTSLFRYKARADAELLAALKDLDEKAQAAQRRTALAILNHAHTVDRIFAANARRLPHAYTTTGAAEPPALEDLGASMDQTDRWYIDYVDGLGADALGESIDFVFTDGARGSMSRQEMLAHVITHGTYHRGEVGRILAQLGVTRPRDIFTGYLHKVEPSRRQR